MYKSGVYDREVIPADLFLHAMIVFDASWRISTMNEGMSTNTWVEDL